MHPVLKRLLLHSCLVEGFVAHFTLHFTSHKLISIKDFTTELCLYNILLLFALEHKIKIKNLHIFFCLIGRCFAWFCIEQPIYLRQT